MSYDHPKGSIKSVPCRACGAEVGGMCRSMSGVRSDPHNGRRADFRALGRDPAEDAEQLDERHASALRLAAHGLKMNGSWWAKAPGCKRTVLSSSVVLDLELAGTLERTKGRGRELSLSPHGEQVLARLETR